MPWQSSKGEGDVLSLALPFASDLFGLQCLPLSDVPYCLCCPDCLTREYHCRTVRHQHVATLASRAGDSPGWSQIPLQQSRDADHGWTAHCRHHGAVDPPVGQSHHAVCLVCTAHHGSVWSHWLLG